MKKRGFTLVELMVVIAIIALLLTMLMPSLHDALSGARDAICKSQLGDWGKIWTMYISDNNGNFNRGWDGRFGGEGQLWMTQLRTYYQDNKDLLLCPEGQVSIFEAGFTPFSAWERAVPSGEGGPEIPVKSSYTINNWTNDMTGDRGHRKEEWFWKSPKDTPKPHTVPVFADGTWNDAWPLDTDQPPPYIDGVPLNDFGTQNEMGHFCIPRHGDFEDAWINCLFMNWGVRQVPLKQLWQLKWHRNFNTANAWTPGGGVQNSDWPEWMQEREWDRD